MLIDIRKHKDKIVQVAFWSILIIGLGARLYQHFMGRSLWEDEAHISLNFIYYGYKGLTQPLANFQAAPIIFLFATETMTRIFGFGEITLRTFPFIVSILSYPLFYFFALELTKNRLAALISFLIFSLNISMIYIASEVKPYTIDIAAYITTGYLCLSQHRFTAKHRTALLCLAGCFFILSSNAGVISLACAGFYIVYKSVTSDSEVIRVSFKKGDITVLACWAVVFTINYFLFIHNHPYSAGMKDIWGHTFIPLNNEELTKFLQQRIDDTIFTDMLYFGKEVYFPYILLLIVAISIGYMFYRKRSSIIIFTLLPILIHFTLSALKIYPFFYRFILHLLPSFIILISLGMAVIAMYLYRKMHVIPAALFLLICFTFCLRDSIKGYPSHPREIKPSLDFINDKYPNLKVFVTTPLTLYQFYDRTGYVKNHNYEALQWNITPDQYFESVKKEPNNYVLLHSIYGLGDGYGPILEELKKDSLVVDQFEYTMYGVMVVKPKP